MKTTLTPSRFTCLRTAACLLVGLVSAATFGTAAEKPEPIGSDAARHDPYRLVGRFLFSSGNGDFIGTASVVGKRGVVTSASNLYDPFDGFSFRIKFERGRYGNRAPQRVSPTRSIILSGYISNADEHGPNSSRAFARDLAVVKFNTTLANGDRLTYRNDLTALKESGRRKEAIGYGTDRHNGKQILSAVTTAKSTEIRTGYFDNNGFVAEAGMSGGPLLVSLNSGQELLAIIVSSSKVDTGLRAIDKAAKRFLDRNL